MIAARRSANRILYLIDSYGRRIGNEQEITSHCVEFYSSLLGNDHTLLSDETKERISSLASYSCDEATRNCSQPRSLTMISRWIFFALKSNKTPGPDGYTSEFFKAYWPIIGPDAIEAIREFLTSGQILKQLNCTALVLIPKKPNADKLSDFRPISCCNVIYKVVSKLLARRLEMILPSWISSSQSAFVKGRTLAENILLATEFVQSSNQNRISRRGMLKVDLQKAFDSLNWEFIIHVLVTANLPPVYINWIFQCISTTSFSININGVLSGHFHGTNGLRQGDPLSPSLFVIAMDVFSKLLEQRFNAGNIGFHPKAKKMKITNLAFADDLMIFFDGKPTSLHGITVALEDFYGMSGLQMNRSKTSIFTAGLSLQEEALIAAYGFQLGTLPVRYLGLPLLHRKLRKADYSHLLDQLSSKFNHWSTKLLSFSGRLQLISSVIHSTVNFWMSAFMLPKGCLSAIESLCSRFLWSGNISKIGGAKISWNQVCLPKDEGGLGLRKLTTWNKVLNLRLIWMLFANKDSLWVAWTKTHRFQGTSFWDAPSSPNASWLWKSLMALRPIAKMFITCKIANGNTASFWKDSWTTLGPLLDLTGPSGPQSLGVPISATVKQATNDLGWILPSSRTRNNSLAQIAHVLGQIRIPTDEDGSDTFYWQVDSKHSNIFSSKLTWERLRPADSKKAWARTIWYKGHIPKLAFNFWVAQHNRLPTRARMALWNPTFPRTCIFCNLEDESREHLFFSCSFALLVWDLVFHRLGLTAPPFSDWASMIAWLSAAGSSTKTLKCLATQVTIYLIWKERNSRLHSLVSLSAPRIFSQIDRLVRDSILARIRRKNHKNLLSLWFTYE